MSSLTYDDDDPIFPHKPWIAIAVPFCVVVAILACSATVFLKRRRKLMKRNGVSLDQQGRLALQRDILLEDGYSQRERQHGTGTGGRRLLPPRVINRWGFITNSDVVAAGRRSARAHRLEGLDEHGEAPPPYESYKSQPKVVMVGEGGEGGEGAELGGAEAAGVSVPTPAHVRGAGGAGSEGAASAGRRRERARSLDGDTIAADTTATGVSVSALLSSSSPPSRPTSSSSTTIERTPASTPSRTAAAAAASPVAPATLPPAYSERAAFGGAGR